MTSLVDSFLSRTPAEEEVPLEWSDLLPDHVSFSQLGQFVRCDEQYRQRVILGHKEPPKGYLAWGSADSATAAFNFSQKVESHEDLPTAAVTEVFASELDRIVDEFGGESQVDWESSSAADVKDKGVALAAAYHKVAAPKVQPVAVEEKFQLVIPTLPVPLIGYLDAETEHTILERKTSARKWTVPEGNYQAQARIYQLAKRKPVHFHVSTKTQTPGIYTPAEEPGLELPFVKAELAMTERWVLSTVRAILATLREFGPDEPWPGVRAQNRSSCSWCGYKPSCPWWQA